MSVTWAQIVDALGGHSVWERSFGREFLHGSVDPDSLRPSLGWHVIDELMQTSTIEPMMIRLSSDPVAFPGSYIDTRIDGADIVHRSWRYGSMIEYLRSGATLVTNRADSMHTGPARLREQFEYFVDDPGWVNSYACWTTSSAFGRHNDGHTVVVVQAEGAKLWRVWSGRDGGADLIFEKELQPGDICSIPANWDHQATGVGPSLHWTFGMHWSSPGDMARMALDAWTNRSNDRASLHVDPDPSEVIGMLEADVPRAKRLRSAESLERRTGLSLPWSIGGDSLAGTRLRWAARFPPTIELAEDAILVKSLGLRLRLDRRLGPWIDEWSAGRAVLRDRGPETDLTEEALDKGIRALVEKGLVLVEPAGPAA